MFGPGLIRLRCGAVARAEGGASIYDAPVPGLALSGSGAAAPAYDYEQLKK
jgi:hypothetical protein